MHYAIVFANSSRKHRKTTTWRAQKTASRRYARVYGRRRVLYIGFYLAYEIAPTKNQPCPGRRVADGILRATVYVHCIRVYRGLLCVLGIFTIYRATMSFPALGYAVFLWYGNEKEFFLISQKLQRNGTLMGLLPRFETLHVHSTQLEFSSRYTLKQQQ